MNIGAAGTLVVRELVGRTKLRAEFARGPNGRIDSVLTDVIGRDTLLRSPIDATHLAWTRTAYDVMDRLTKAVSFGPAVTVTAPGASFTAPADSLVVDHEYDAEGNLTRVARFRGIRFPGYAPLVASYVYDGAGRKTAETLDGRTQTYGYDPAGNVRTHATGRGTVTHSYDALGQLRTRIVPELRYAAESCATYLPPGCGSTLPNFPTAAGTNEVCIPADTAYYEYDAAGRLTTADNIYGRVRRRYHPSGLLVRDTLRVRSYYSSGSSPCETLASGEVQPEFGGTQAHVYGLTYSYDLEGRRISLVHPGGTQTYAYDSIAPKRGLLVQTKDIATRSFTFEYDAAGRRRVTRYPGSVVETLGFAADGRLTARTVGSGIVGFIDDALAYDFRDRVIAATTGYRAGAPSGQTATTWYGGLGAVIAADNHGNAGGWAEGFEVDALGNRVRKQQQGMRPSWHPDYYGIRFSSYDADGHLVTVSDTNTAPPDQYTYGETYLYDAGGARTLQYSVEWDAQSNVSKQGMARSYSSVDDKLRVFERNAKGGAGEPGERPVSEEYRYDALGRRVLTRSRRLPGCDPASLGIECASVIERVAWDGDQVLLEARANGAEGLTSQQLEQETSSGGAYGRVVYAHAAGIDQPLSVSKDGVAVMPHLNWRGQYDVGALADGSSTRSCTGTPSCPMIAWPGGARSLDQETLDPQVMQTWFGNLITDKADGSGLLYKRHRYYDPKTGQFTQQDPIGLAGGLNSYGYASGDPVSYSDPFGLCCFMVGLPHSSVYLGLLGGRFTAPPNERKIASLNPSIQSAARQFMNLSAMSGRPMRITEGYRSLETQAEYYSRGRTTPGPKITNAPPGMSAHNYGLAIDAYPAVHGQANFGATRADYEPVARLAGEVGFEWGGAWTGFKDMPHFQMLGGKTLQQLNAERVKRNQKPQ